MQLGILFSNNDQTNPKGDFNYTVYIDLLLRSYSQCLKLSNLFTLCCINIYLFDNYFKLKLPTSVR
jgi:hypothetical protein